MLLLNWKNERSRVKQILRSGFGMMISQLEKKQEAHRIRGRFLSGKNLWETKRIFLSFLTLECEAAS
jgi:hypothetical protein